MKTHKWERGLNGRFNGAMCSTGRYADRGKRDVYFSDEPTCLRCQRMMKDEEEIRLRRETCVDVDQPVGVGCAKTAHHHQ